MAIKCIKQLKRDDLTDNYEKYVKSGMSEYDAGIKVAAEYHRELFDEVADFRATVLGEDAAKAKAGYVPFDSTEIDKKYKTIASDRQAEQARVVAEQAKTKAEAEAKAEAARIKAETPKIKIEQKPKVESTTLKSSVSPTPKTETQAPLSPTSETQTKIPIAKKPLTQIEAKGDKVYNKVEFTPKATVKESLSGETPTKPLVRDLTDEEVAQRVAAASITKSKNGYVVKDLWPGKTFASKAEAETAVQDWAKAVRKVEMVDWRNATENDLYTEQKALRRVAESLKTDTDLSDLLTRVEKQPPYGEKGNLLWSIAQNPNASPSTKAKALKAYKNADRDSPTTTTYTDGTRTGTLETMPNGTQRIRLRPAKVGSPMDGTTAMSARWKPTSEPMESAKDSPNEITDSKGNIDYAKSANVAGRIERGEATIKRLDTDGEQGRIAGGKRAVESSIILARSERASEESGSRTRPVERQERTLEEYAKRAGIWIDPREAQQNIVGKGNEATVHSVDNGKSVQKVINYKQIEKDATPLDFIDNRIATFNHIFPETKYELVGFTRTKDGFRFVIKQPLIRDAVYTTAAERQAFMKSKGFEMVDKYGEEFANEFYHVSDLHEKNALKMPDGSIVVIDAVTKAKPVSEFEVVDKSLSKSLDKSPMFKGNEPMESARDTSSEPFYSALERTIEQKMPERASADQVKGIIRETKQEERDWLGIDQYLAENPRVSKADLLEFIRGNQVQVEEVMLGEKYEPNSKAKPLIEELRTLRQKDSPTSADTQRISDLYGEIGEVDPDYFVEKDSKEWSANPTKFSQYVLPGGENYKELLLVMPRKGAVSSEKRYEQLMDIADRRDLTDAEQREVEAIERAEFNGESVTGGDDFRSGHFDEPNILAHIRFDDRTVDGKRVLHIAEIQSDWHQAGRKQGYKTTELPTGWTIQETTDGWHIKDETGLFRSHGTTRAAAIKMIDGVPNAPFKKSWQELAFKKILRHAVENGYDAVSWDTGETQADRYDLSKQIDSINVPMVNDDGSRAVRIDPKDGESFKLMVDEQGIVTGNYSASQFSGKSLDDVIGKEMAQKVMDAPSNTKFTGVDLKVGGEGMKGFYDKILPTFVNKYVKKWGSRVDRGSLEIADSPRNASPSVIKALANEQLMDGDTGASHLLSGIARRGTVANPWTVLESMRGENLAKFGVTPKSFDIAKKALDDAFKGGTADVHSLTITPAMRDSVMEGQPMFRSREEMEASKESFEAAKKLPIEELLAIADPKKITHEDGVIDMADVAEYELVRRVMGNAFGKTGMAAVFQEPSVAQKFIETARDLATQANEAGVDGTKFTELANIVEDATKAANGTAIFYIDESDLGEEKAHRSLYMLRKGDRPTQVPKSDLDTFVAEPIVQKALSGKFGKLYKNKSKAAQMEEFAVKAARGQWGDLDITSEGDKRAAAQVAINYLAKFAETNAKEGQTKDQLLKQLAQEIVYGEEARDIQETYESESRPSVQSTENLNKQVADGGQGKTVSGEQYEPSGETRLSQTPISAREKANIPLKDEQYVSASNAEQQEFADRQLAKGADSAMDWFKSQVADNNLNNGATGVVGLNLANYYGMQGDYAKMNEVAELLVPAITEAAQSVQAMRVLSKFDPKMALTYAATRKMKATNKPLTDREIRRLNPKIEKLANAENDKNVTQNAVENLKQGIANADSVSQGLQTALNDATKATTADPTTVRKQVETSRKQSRPKPKKADRAEIEARIKAQFGTMESAREELGDDKYQDLIDLIALDILDYKTPAETYNHIQLLTGEAITPEQFVELQLDGWRASKAEKDFTPTENLTAEQREAREERIARRTARLAHQRMAFGTQGKKAGPQKPNVFDREIRKQGIDRGYSDIEIVGAILMPKLSGTKATEDWYKQMKAAYPDTDVDTFARSYELRQAVLENVQEQRMLARAEKAGYEKDLPKFENELKHRNRLVREGQTDLDNEYRKLQRGWRDVALTGAAEAMGLFKGLTSWGEISYILRQGFIPLLTDTRAALKGDWQGVGHGLQGDNALWKWAAEKGGFEDVAQYLNDHSLSMFVEKIRQHPRFLEAQNNGVRFTQIGDFNIADDHFSTKMLEWIPMYKRAEVAYTLPGDLQRLFIYDSWAKGLDELGLTKEELKKAKRYAAETANAFTGKGDIAKVLARGGTLSKLANITWFSPQLLISRFQSAYRLSTGFATAPKGMKFQMAKKGLRFYGAIGVLMYLAGAVLDPEDDDFGKVNIKKDSWLASKIPDARDFHIDMLSGLDLPIQNGLRLMFGVGKSVYNQDIAYAGDAKDAIWNEMVANKSGEARLFRSKLSPGASLLVDIGKGTDFLGRPTTAWGAFTSRALPLAWQQTYDALLYDRLQSMQREPQTFENAQVKLSNEQKYENALLMMLGTFVGVGITQYPKDDPSKAMQLTRQLSSATSSKDAETKRTEGALRNLYKAQQEALRANEPVERINREIQSYMNKYPALRKAQNDLLSQAKSQTGLFSYYAKDVSLDGLLRIRKVAEGAELEVVNKLIKAAEKKKR